MQLWRQRAGAVRGICEHPQPQPAHLEAHVFDKAANVELDLHGMRERVECTAEWGNAGNQMMQWDGAQLQPAKSICAARVQLAVPSQWHAPSKQVAFRPSLATIMSGRP